MKTPNEFYDDCVQGFVAVAQGFGYAMSGYRGNDVLTKKAFQSVRELLKYRPLIVQFKDDPAMYYYYIYGLAFAMGIVLAMLQANAPEKFREKGLVKRIVNDPETSAHDLAFHAMRQYGMNQEMYGQLLQELFAKFMELNEPYCQAKEPRDYALSAFYAAFMTGCSVVLERFDMKRAEIKVGNNGGEKEKTE